MTRRGGLHPSAPDHPPGPVSPAKSPDFPAGAQLFPFVPVSLVDTLTEEMRGPDRDELEAMEKDPLWDLVRASPRPGARPDFASKVVRAARLQESSPAATGWQRWFAPLAISSGLAAAAAVVLAMAISGGPDIAAGPAGPIAGTEADAAGAADPADSATELELTPVEDGLRTEVLIVAAENPGDFSDAELVSLISY